MEFDPRRAKWQQIQDAIIRRIRAGEYAPGFQLSEVRLSAEFGVNRDTLRKTTRSLREAGWITTTPGLGSFVADEQPTDE
ncbi:GntR family transcriptional regulator [Streptomyces sp. NPDC058623]|uniref:GntR family transcriptional regulator n=1 Tax=Streptomyces sp. NPDC058623 TaxID=3346563 RepID=UPI003658BC79